MATVNFSVPSDVKEAFDKAFRRQNKSAVLTELMRQAVDERQRRPRRRARLLEELLALRKRTRRITDRAVRAARRRWKTVTTVVLDASVIVKWISRIARKSRISPGPPNSPVHQGVSGHGCSAAALVAEVAAVIVRLDPGPGSSSRRASARAGTCRDRGRGLSEGLRAFGVAETACVRYLYHAVALTEPGAMLVTADEQYYRKAHRVGRIVRLKEFSLSMT